MPSLELSNDQAALLKEYLERDLSDLSVEIAGTDKRAYREQIKAERQMLRAVFEQLAALVPSEPSA